MIDAQGKGEEVELASEGKKERRRAEEKRRKREDSGIVDLLLRKREMERVVDQ